MGLFALPALLPRLTGLSGEPDSHARLLSGILLAGWWPFFIGEMVMLRRAWQKPARALRLWTIPAFLTNLGLLLIFTTPLTQTNPDPGSWLALSGALVGAYLLISSQPGKETGSPQRILREFGLSISKLLDPDHLAAAAPLLIQNALQANQSAFFWVVIVQESDSEVQYRLDRLKNQGPALPVFTYLPGSTPVVRALLKEKRPLVLQPRRLPSGSDLERFSSQGLRVFAPVFVKEEWVGLVALGEKLSKKPYSEEDIDLIGVMADQTGIALQNARLVENLTRVYNDFRRAYLTLERTKEQLERLDQTKTDFISICSHELRTPLSVIRGYSEMLNSEPAIQENGYHARMVSGILNGTSRLHEVVDSMLDMASLDNRSFKIHKEPVSLDVILRLAGESFRRVLAERQLSLVYKNLLHLPEIQADTEALLKLFSQLIENAIKFTPNNGCITIWGLERLEGQQVEILVQDTGIGIDPQAQELIFTKFYQTGKLELHSSGNQKFKGAGPGLGLAIARGIVEGHGGKIWVESTGFSEDTCPGSIFHVLLPVD